MDCEIFAVKTGIKRYFNYCYHISAAIICGVLYLCRRNKCKLPLTTTILPCPSRMLRYILLPLLSLLVWSCSCQPSGIDATLAEAERLMDARPDSALTLVESIDPSAIHSRSTRALHALLLTQAQFKNYIDVPNDSLISIAVDYYDSSRDSYRKMLSLYYFGRVRLQSKDYSKSLYSLIKAKDLAESLDDDFWVAMCAQRIADIYNETYNYNEAVKYVRIEFDRFQKAGKSKYITWAMLDLAQSYYAVEKYDSCMILCKQLLDSALRYSDEYLRQDVGRAMGLCNFVQDNYEEARKIYEEICRMDDANVNDSAYLGLTYVRLGKLEKGRDLLKAISDVSAGPGVWFRYSYYTAVDSTEKALTSLKILDEDSEKIIRELVNHDLSGVLMDYHEYDRKILESELNNHRLIIALILISSISIGVISLLMFLRYRKKQILLIERNLAVARNFKEIMETHDKVSKETIRHLMADRFEVFDEMMKVMYEDGDSERSKKRISEMVNMLVKDFSRNKKKIAELESYVDKHYGNIFTSFRMEFPKLVEADYLFFLYSIFGFSNSSIALFLQEKDTMAVYDRRKRMKRRIKNSTSKDKDRFLVVLG